MGFFASLFGSSKPPQPLNPEVGRPTSNPPEKSPQQKMDEAAQKVATALRSYEDAAYRASNGDPGAELVEARAKLAAARKLVVEGRLAYALGRCLPEHMKHWPSWIKRDDFISWVYFDAQHISASQEVSQDGHRKVGAATVNFTFNDTRYTFVLRDKGFSMVPDTSERDGEIELWVGDDLVAKFEVIEDCSKDYSYWEYSDVRALKVGPWMKDVIDMSVQIEATTEKRGQDVVNTRDIEAARNIRL